MESAPITCKEDEFKCQSGTMTCIPATWRCDGENDCTDKTDELNCGNNTCSDFQFACEGETNRCIYTSWVCDGDDDCPDGKDEKNCTVTQPTTTENPFIKQVSVTINLLCKLKKKLLFSEWITLPRMDV